MAKLHHRFIDRTPHAVIKSLEKITFNTILLLSARLCANKPFHTTDDFSHHAILIFGGSNWLERSQITTVGRVTNLPYVNSLESPQTVF